MVNIRHSFLAALLLAFVFIFAIFPSAIIQRSVKKACTRHRFPASRGGGQRPFPMINPSSALGIFAIIKKPFFHLIASKQNNLRSSRLTKTI